MGPPPIDGSPGSLTSGSPSQAAVTYAGVRRRTIALALDAIPIGVVWIAFAAVEMIALLTLGAQPAASLATTP